MADLTKQSVTLAGTGPTYAAASAGGDKLPSPTARSWLAVKNTSGAPVTVTIATPRVDPTTKLAETDVIVSVPATTGERLIGPLDPSVVADPADLGKAAVTYSASAGVTVGYFEV